MRKAQKAAVVIVLLCVVAFFIHVLGFSRIIYRTDKGFEPSFLIVFPGTSVTFVNKTSRDFWPASDLHPSHTAYSGFDPRRAIGEGGSWQFRFAKTGSWAFHDHLDPEVQGSITVSVFTSSKENVSDSFEQCLNAPDYEGGKCWMNVARHRVDLIGVDGVLEEIAALFSIDAGLQSYCHDITHIIGNEAYSQFKQHKRIDFNKDQAMCTWGFFHGFMEQMFKDGGSIADSVSICDGINEENDDIKKELLSNCYHGLGHGSVLKHEENPDFDFWKILDTGLGECELASADLLPRENCVSGVIDGLLAAGIAGEYPIPDEIYSDPYSICKKYPAYAACYSATNWFALHASGKSFPKVASYVATIQDREIARDTMHWLANLTVRIMTEADKARSAAWCSDAGDLQTACISGFAMGYILNKGINGNEYTEGISYCLQNTLSEEQRTDCFAGVIDYVQEHNGQALKERICHEYGLADTPECKRSVKRI